ncbi:MAG: hypothetical protein OXT65_07785 [Alphaproteobacteria bacterium]|nr:hypothetical protein [Alphaproteobacteria bacterium]
MKIFVTGNAGSGKTTLARRIAKERRLPYYTLDSIVWKSGWKKTAQEEKKQKIAALTAEECWVIDGVSHDVMAAADIVYFLDVPRYRCILNILRRFLRYGWKTRPDFPSDCPEYIGVLKALRIAWLFPRKGRQHILFFNGRRKLVRLRDGRAYKA